MSEPFLINRVILQNYRSIAYCDVELRNLTFLSGPNGSGKSNFMDALRFVADSLRTSLEHAMRERGGIREMICRTGAPSDGLSDLSIEIYFAIGTSVKGQFSFCVRSAAQGSFYVLREHCSISDAVTGEKHHYTNEDGVPFQSSPGVPPPTAPLDRLHLALVSGVEAFRPVANALASMGFYNPDPRSMAAPRAANELDDILLPSGANVASVLDRLSRYHEDVKSRIESYLRGIVPSLSGFYVTADVYRFIRFKFEFPDQKAPLVFLAESMSDGTLRALGLLVALFQKQENGSGRSLSLVGIEEPEVALHPAAARLLLDALSEASESRQVIVTTHSPDLLDSNDIDNDSILAVQIGEDGATLIGPVDDAGRQVLKDRLYTVGELMRLNQLQPQRSAADGLALADEVQTKLSPDEP